MKKVLIKDLVIPAGTIFSDAPVRTDRLGKEHIQATIGLSDNTSGSVLYWCGDDAEELQEWFRDVK